MKSFTAPTVLVIDDVGLIPIGGTEASAVCFQVVNTRSAKGHPAIVTANRSLPDWGAVSGASSSPHQPPAPCRISMIPDDVIL
ncbi:MAG: DNA replication protein DnaC [Ilumatobacter sp.]|jgi:DNA replication protein DnaC